jgi:hypothetical protein
MMEEQRRNRLIALLGITEVAQMELDENLVAFFACVPEMAEVQKYSDRMTVDQARDIWATFTRIIGEE